jgi:mannosyl-3-phosphoglycerate phosphatase
VENAEIRDGYEVLEWGEPYGKLAAALERAAVLTECPVAAFHTMDVQAVAEATGLPNEAAALAKQREYDEVFSAPNKVRARRLLEAIDGAGLRWTHGGRFYHICGNNDKGKAVAALMALYRERAGYVESIGLGDSMNDLPFLEIVDIPVLIRSERPPSIYFRTIGARITRNEGPEGWNEEVLGLLARREPQR